MPRFRYCEQDDWSLSTQAFSLQTLHGMCLMRDPHHFMSVHAFAADALCDGNFEAQLFIRMCAPWQHWMHIMPWPVAPCLPYTSGPWCPAVLAAGSCAVHFAPSLAECLSLCRQQASVSGLAFSTTGVRLGLQHHRCTEWLCNR